MTNVNQAEFEGKVAIVTGAASGIGRATTTLPNSCGASVVAEDIKPEVDQLASNNERIATIVGDVSSEETAKRAVALAISRCIIPRPAVIHCTSPDFSTPWPPWLS